MTGTGLTAGGREGGFYPEKREDSIKKSPDRREAHPEEERRGRLVACPRGFALRSDGFGGDSPSLPAPRLGAGSAGGGGGEVSWRYRSEHCQGLLWGRSLRKGWSHPANLH